MFVRLPDMWERRYGSGAVSPASQATAFSSSWRINWRTVHPRFTLFQSCMNFRRVGPSAEVLGLLLQQADQPHRIDVVFSLNSITPPFSLLSSLRI